MSRQVAIRKTADPVTMYDVEGPLSAPTFVKTAHGPAAAQIGDYLLTDPETDHVWVVPGEVFQRQFKILILPDPVG